MNDGQNLDRVTIDDVQNSIRMFAKFADAIPSILGDFRTK